MDDWKKRFTPKNILFLLLLGAGCFALMAAVNAVLGPRIG